MNEVIEHESQAPAYHGSPLSTSAMILDGDTIDRMMRVAEIMATGKATIPQHLRGNPGDCMAVVMQAMQWKMNPFAVAQKTHLVNGALGYEAQLVNAVVSSSALLKSRLNYSWDGDWSKCNGKNDKSPSLTVTVSATLKGEIEPRTLTISMAQAGVRNSPNWEHDPKQQLAYLCTKRWARLHAPDVLLGVYTPDELEDRQQVERDITPTSERPAAAPATRTAALKDKLKGKGATQAALPAPSLDEVTEAIRAASCKADMDKAKELVNQLPDDQRADAVSVFNERAQQLRDLATKKQTEETTFDAAGFAKRLQACSDLDTLDLMADELRAITDQAARAHLEAVYQERRAELVEG